MARRRRVSAFATHIPSFTVAVTRTGPELAEGLSKEPALSLSKEPALSLSKGHPLTRVRYSPVRVSTLIFSPSSTKVGTCI